MVHVAALSCLMLLPPSRACLFSWAESWLLIGRPGVPMQLTATPAGRSWRKVLKGNIATSRALISLQFVAFWWSNFSAFYECEHCVPMATGKKLIAPILLDSGDLNGWPGLVHGGNLGLWLAERASLAPRVSWGEIEYISVSLSGCWALASLEPSTQRETLSGGHSSPWIPADVIGTESLLLLWQRWRHQRATLNCNSFIGKQWRSKIKSKKIKAFNVTRTHRLNYLLLQRSAIFIIA